MSVFLLGPAIFIYGEIFNLLVKITLIINFHLINKYFYFTIGNLEVIHNVSLAPIKAVQPFELCLYSLNRWSFGEWPTSLRIYAMVHAITRKVATPVAVMYQWEEKTP